MPRRLLFGIRGQINLSLKVFVIAKKHSNKPKSFWIEKSE
jgi:hypothetical protein